MTDIQGFPLILFVRKTRKGMFFSFRSLTKAKEFIEFGFPQGPKEECIIGIYALTSLKQYTKRQVEEEIDLLEDGKEKT